MHYEDKNKLNFKLKEGILKISKRVKKRILIIIFLD